MNSMRIGVFDSGKGGRLVAARLEALLPGHEWIIVDDIENVPYGEKDRKTIIALTEQAIAPLITECPIVVIACNTATTAAISTLRERYPSTHFVGVEPMIKPAAMQSISRHITMLATPYTLTSTRYHDLKVTYGSGVRIDEPTTKGWPKYIDDGKRERIDFSGLDTSVANGSDTIVIACTHYLDLLPTLSARYPGASLLEPCEALARRIDELQHASSAA